MHFDVHAVPAEQFSTWIETARATGPTLDAASYTTLTKQSTDVDPYTYRATSPELFQQIASQTLPPGPGPQAGRPNPDVSPRTE
jgi:cytochrome o ubiquinol oxidase subunit 2